MKFTKHERSNIHTASQWPYSTAKQMNKFSHTHNPLGTIDLIKANACTVFNIKTLSSSLMLTDNYKSAICMLQIPSLCGPTCQLPAQPMMWVWAGTIFFVWTMKTRIFFLTFRLAPPTVHKLHAVVLIRETPCFPFKWPIHKQHYLGWMSKMLLDTSTHPRSSVNLHQHH